MSDAVRFRVRVLESWEDVVLELEPDTPIGDIKRTALDAVHLGVDPSRFLVKFRGAEVSDESRTLADIRVPNDAGLIVLRRRRVPVR